jgi:prepilin-type N-terminal cleavage/methylation domain-containing protein
MKTTVQKLLTLNLKGFSLVEVLVVISVLVILSAIGLVVYINTQKIAQESRLKADVEAIAEALEQKYDPVTDSYVDITDADFTNGTIPKTPSGVDYHRSLSSGNRGFIVCASLISSEPTCSNPGANCYCVDSTQGQYAP